jgi:hypothetical protein
MTDIHFKKYMQLGTTSKATEKKKPTEENRAGLGFALFKSTRSSVSQEWKSEYKRNPMSIILSSRTCHINILLGIPWPMRILVFLM